MINHIERSRPNRFVQTNEAFQAISERFKTGLAVGVLVSIIGIIGDKKKVYHTPKIQYVSCCNPFLSFDIPSIKIDLEGRFSIPKQIGAVGAIGVSGGIANNVVQIAGKKIVSKCRRRNNENSRNNFIRI